MVACEQLFPLIFAYLDSFTLYRLLSVSHWLRDTITGSSRIWRCLLTDRFPLLAASAASCHDYLALHRRLDRGELVLLRFGEPPSVQGYSQHPDSLLRVPSGYKSIRSVACGGYFFAVHTTSKQLIVMTDRHRQDVLLGVDEFVCGRRNLLYRCRGHWFHRRTVMSYSTCSGDVAVPDADVRLIACGWETPVIITGSNQLRLLVANEPTWPLGIDAELMGCGEDGVVIVNATGMFRSPYGPPSWTLLYAFAPGQRGLRLKVWFRSIALQTTHGWVVKLPKSTIWRELGDTVHDVHLGDWHYVFVMADGSVRTGGDHCRGANLGTDNRPIDAPVNDDVLADAACPPFQYSCGGWQTVVLGLPQ